jgi:hypothetical protein
VIRPVTTLVERPCRVGVPFILAEVLLVVAIPVLALFGVDALLDSRAGIFVDEPQAGDPGYRALVDASPVTAVVEITDQRLTGIALLAQPGEQQLGGSALLVPGELQLEGVPLGSLSVADAVAALEKGLRLRITRVETVDEARWAALFSDTVYTIDNPDPVVSADGSTVFGVGAQPIGGDAVGLLLGLSVADADPRSLLVRRHRVWESILDEPPTSADQIAGLMTAISGGPHRVTELAMLATPDDELAGGVRLTIDPEQVEAQINEAVPFPSGAFPGDRLRVRVIDQVGDGDLLAVAADLGRSGYEVAEIGAAAFPVDSADAVMTVVVPLDVDDEPIAQLAAALGAATMVSNETDADGVVTLLLGTPVGG